MTLNFRLFYFFIASAEKGYQVYHHNCQNISCLHHILTHTGSSSYTYYSIPTVPETD